MAMSVISQALTIHSWPLFYSSFFIRQCITTLCYNVKFIFYLHKFRVTAFSSAQKISFNRYEVAHIWQHANLGTSSATLKCLYYLRFKKSKAPSPYLCDVIYEWNLSIPGALLVKLFKKLLYLFKSLIRIIGFLTEHNYSIEA